MPKVNICAFDHECIKTFQRNNRFRCFPTHQKQCNQLCYRSLSFFLNNILPILHSLDMFVIILFCLCPHESFKVWNSNTFFQKCNFVQYYKSSLSYSFQFSPLHLHRPLSCFHHHLHLRVVPYFHLHFCG
jgi:hypothetical protein